MISYIDNISNVVQEISLTIEPTDWSSYLGSYVYNWTDARIAPGSSVDVDFLDSTEDTTAPYIEFEKLNNGIQFTSDVLPTDDIAVLIRIINAQADLGTSLRADAIQSDAVTSAANVEEALTILDSRIDALDPESSTSVFTDVPFSIIASAWTNNSGTYTYTYNNVLIKETSGVEIFYDSTYRSALTGDVYTTKNTGSVTFTTTGAPANTLSGTIRIIESVSGVIPTWQGGTGAITAKGARTNLNTTIKPIHASFGTVSSLPQTVYDADITADMIPMNVVYGNPSACPKGMTCTTAAGSVTISLPSGGSFSGSTTVDFDLVNQRTVVDGGSGQEEEQVAANYVQISAQTLTNAEKTQVRTNVGAASASDVSTLSEAIANLRTKTTGTITKTTVSSGGTLDSTTLYKVGDTVFASGRIHTMSNVGTNNAMFQIPEGFRPATQTYVMGFMQITYGGSDLGARPTSPVVNTNGTVQFNYSSTATTNQVYFSGSWSVV